MGLGLYGSSLAVSMFGKVGQSQAVRLVYTYIHMLHHTAYSLIHGL